MSLWTTIASEVFEFGFSKFAGSRQDKGISAPKFKIRKAPESLNVPNIQGSRPIRTGTLDLSSSTGQIQRLINRHEAIMASFDADEGAVKGRYGTQSI